MVILPLEIINYIFLFKQPHASTLLIKDVINTTVNNKDVSYLDHCRDDFTTPFYHKYFHRNYCFTRFYACNYSLSDFYFKNTHRMKSMINNLIYLLGQRSGFNYTNDKHYFEKFILTINNNNYKINLYVESLNIKIIKNNDYNSDPVKIKRDILNDYNNSKSVRLKKIKIIRDILNNYKNKKIYKIEIYSTGCMFIPKVITLRTNIYEL